MKRKALTPPMRPPSRPARMALRSARFPVFSSDGLKARGGVVAELSVTVCAHLAAVDPSMAAARKRTAPPPASAQAAMRRPLLELRDLALDLLAVLRCLRPPEIVPVVARRLGRVVGQAVGLRDVVEEHRIAADLVGLLVALDGLRVLADVVEARRLLEV